MRARFKYTFLIALLFELVFIGNTFSQNQHFSFNCRSTLNGLSNNFVTAVLEDSRGFIWIATSDGLNRYDGQNFVTFKYDVKNPNSLPNNYILCLAEDSSKNIWVGTNQSGIARYNLEEEKFYRYTHIRDDATTIPGTVIRKIIIDKLNTIWICTDSGLARYDAKSDNFQRYSFPISDGRFESNVDVREVFQLVENELIIQCDLGLYKMNLKNENIYKIELVPIPSINSEYENNIALLFDKHNNIWAGRETGLSKYNFKTKQYTIYKHNKDVEGSISSLNISTIFQDSKGQIWVGTRDNGVSLYNITTDDFTVFKSTNRMGNGLSNNIITHIYEDSHGSIWFSTQEGGVNYINSNSNYFEHFSHNPLDNSSISNNTTNSFYEDNHGAIWVGTGDGILNKLLKTKKFDKYPLKCDYISPSILGITSHNENSLLITGWGVGLFEFNATTKLYKNLMKGKGLNGKSLPADIKGLGTDSDGNIWLASHNESGLLVYKPSEKEFYNASNPGPFNVDLLKVPYAVTMMQDRSGRIWIVSYTGLYMFDSVFHVYKNVPDDKNTLGSDYVYTIFEDVDAQLWVGNSNGLDRVIENNGVITFERMNYSYPIPTNIKTILQDNGGYLWLSSNSELTQFHPLSKKIKHYKINKELPSQEFAERACLKASNGEMYFGGTSGFFRFRPDSISDSQINPKVYLIDFMLFNKSQTVNAPNSPLKKSILETDKIELSYDQSVISFEYVALNYDPYKTIEYAYKMEGFDKDWYVVGDKRSVTYTNLKHGEYTFKVKLVEGNKILDEGGAQVNLIIYPPYWQTNLAYVVYIIFFFLLLYLFRLAILNREKLKNELKLEKINIKNVREANLMKLRFFTNISHEFRTPLTLIKAPLEKLLEPDEKLSPEIKKYHLDLIYKNTERLLKMINQLMDYRKLEAGSLVLEPSHGDIVEFCKGTWSAFSFLADQKEIKYIFESQFEKLNMAFDSDKLDKVLSNLLSNAFKYTQKYGQISVLLSKTIEANGDPEKLKIVVRDTGIGIRPKDLPHIFERFYSVSQKKAGKIEGTGIGLTLAKELTELHKGSIHVKSILGEGAEFTVQLPLVNHTEEQSKTDYYEFEENSQHENAKSKVDALIDKNEKALKPILLLVEDDDDLREFIKNELKSDYEIILAKNGEEGLRKALFELPDMVLSDVMMPKIDGFELCKTLKADERTSHIPIILLTARHSHQKQLEGFDAGADDYIFKPFSVVLLKSRIHNLLSTRKEIVEKFKKGTSLYFDNEGVENKDTQFIQNIIDLVLENILIENINADFIARKLLVSRSLIYLKIEALAGQTVNEFVRNIRLKKSLRLLEQNNMTITEIAYAVGFSSQSYFSRSFTKLYSVSPKEYVSKNKG